jgi:hypothetical protein
VDVIYWIAGLGCFGVTYAVVVVPVYWLALRLYPGRQHRSDRFLLVAPIIVYLVLTWVVEDRQGFNWYISNLIIAAPVTASLFVVMNVSPNRRTLVATIACGLAAIVAVISWKVVPSQGLTRLM